jgi:hypothetical protein
MDNNSYDQLPRYRKRRQIAWVLVGVSAIIVLILYFSR